MANPVNEPIKDSQVRNNAGGFVFKLSDIDRLKRFLILGSDANTFHASAKDLTVENAKVIVSLLSAGRGLEIVQEIESVSLAGRAPRQGPGLFALAMVMVYSHTGNTWDEVSKERRKARKAALEAIPKVCRTASTLYELMLYYKLVGIASQHAPAGKMSGWGSALRKAVGDWFLDRSPSDLAMQVTKYPQRNGVAGRDLLRLSHPQAAALGKRKREAEVEDMNLVLHYATHPEEEVLGHSEVAAFLRDAQRLKSQAVSTPAEAVELIRRHRGLGWEHIGETKLLKSPQLWAALLDQGMGLTALIRNLNRFVEIGLFGTAPEAAKGNMMDVDGLSWQPSKDYMNLICTRLTDEKQLRAGRIHPLRVLMASRMLAKKHASGCIPAPLSAALDSAFELSFASIEPTGKKILIAVDISGSMRLGWCVGTDCLTPMEAAAAVAMMLVRKENDTQVVAFCHRLEKFRIGKTDSLNKVLKTASSFQMGSTDCSLPMVYAKQQKLDVDAFIILTDNETWRGEHAYKTLQEYRISRQAKLEKEGGRQPAKLLVCAFASTGFTIADPEDAGMLDVAGLDASLPEIMRSFILGEI